MAAGGTANGRRLGGGGCGDWDGDEVLVGGVRVGVVILVKEIKERKEEEWW